MKKSFALPPMSANQAAVTALGLQMLVHHLQASLASRGHGAELEDILRNGLKDIDQQLRALPLDISAIRPFALKVVEGGARHSLESIRDAGLL